MGLTPVGSERRARTRLWPFAHSPPTPPLVRPAAPRAPRKPAMARGRTNGQPGSARKVGVWGDRRESSSMCPAASDGCLDRRAGFELLPAVVPRGGPSAPVKSAREEAVWGLLQRRLFVFAVKQTSAECTGSRASPRKPSELVDREVVLSGSPSKARRGSEPICVDIHRHFLSKNQLTSM